MLSQPTKEDALLSDRLEITDLFARWARLLEEKRWDDAGTVFSDDVVLHTPRVGDSAIHGLAASVAYLHEVSAQGAGRSQHFTTDILVEVDGDTAAATANSLVYFYRDGEPAHMSSGLRLTYEAVRTSKGWRFSELTTKHLWTQGER